MNDTKKYPTPLDVMKDGQEFECLVGHQFAPNLNVVGELRRSIAEVEATRKKYVLCYVANVVRGDINNAIDNSDDLPFNEMVNSVPTHVKEVDVVLVTSKQLCNGSTSSFREGELYLVKFGYECRDHLYYVR